MKKLLLSVVVAALFSGPAAAAGAIPAGGLR